MSTATQNTPAPYGSDTQSTPSTTNAQHTTNAQSTTNSTTTSTGETPSQPDTAPTPGLNKAPSHTERAAAGATDAERSTGAGSTTDAPLREDGPAKGTAGVHPSAVGSGTQPSTGGDTATTGAGAPGKDANADAGDGEGAAAPALDANGYPEQRHAGKVDGVGPEYGKSKSSGSTGPTIGERIKGVTDQLIGKVTKNPDKVVAGQQLKTGEGKKEKEEDKEESNPFATAGGGKDEKEGDKTTGSGEGPAKKEQTEAGTTDVPAAHPTDKGAAEQAASVAPAGTEPSARDVNAKQRAESATLGN